MKLLTLNTHSLAEPEYERKLHLFARMAEKERPDIIALQEVNQTGESSPAPDAPEYGYMPCSGHEGPVREDNHALNLAKLLKSAGVCYRWTWVPVKLGYGVFEEGLALFSLKPIEDTEQFFISKSHSFSNWKTRKAVGIQVGGQWFYSVHMGWWGDEEEPFACHWDHFQEHVKGHRGDGKAVWVMGDFNSPCDRAGEGYDYVRNSGWRDTYEMATEKDGGITVGHVIDGWRREEGEQKKRPPGMRIDYIWCGDQADVSRSLVVCNDVNYPVVSDHYGLMALIDTES